MSPETKIDGIKELQKKPSDAELGDRCGQILSQMLQRHLTLRSYEYLYSEAGVAAVITDDDGQKYRIDIVPFYEKGK